PFTLRDGVNIIAELKRKSPSAGDIGEIDDRRIAVYSQYATAISILTDATYFGGSFDVLAGVAGKTGIPILCKDFFIDTSQIDLAWSKGADMILLVARILDENSLKHLYDHARRLGLNCLVEVHEAQELKKIAGLNADIVGVNARDLDTLAIDLDRAKEILSRVEAPVRVAESGIKSRADIEQFAGTNCFLIGETLMRTSDLESTFRELLYG
ncbi:MAG: Indole-3-glycerol-phosphate synthase, partial [Deltaproteobacteria bacterium]|nr:Indole-3-glycerol-phosphate synthase [Deltaproteobacteria bacterium]